MLNSRQMGQSSLLVRTRQRLLAAGWQCATLDLTTLGSAGVTPLQWYKGLATELWLGLGLVGRVQFQQGWQAQEDLSLIQRLSRFLGKVVLPAFPKQPIAIFLDEIDSILSLEFLVDDFFALIRACYNQRANEPAYRRLTFAVSGVATPSDLIQDQQRTPFNIGRAIALTGFTAAAATPLDQGLPLPPATAAAALEAIVAWTAGQPFLTQKLCQLLVHTPSLPAEPAAWRAWFAACVQDQLPVDYLLGDPG